MNLTFGDILANALAEIKEYSGKKIGILQDELSYAFSPPLSSKTIESWRYRQAPPTIEQLETLAVAVIKYRCPSHDSQWLMGFLEAANHPYPQAVCGRLFPLETQYESAYHAQFAPPPLEAYAPPQIDELIGRAQELTHYQQLLAQSGLAIVSGMAGVGKTSVAAFLANMSVEEMTFWHDFRDANIHSLIYRLAGFLAHHRQTELWEMLESARLTRSNPPDLTIALDILAAQMTHLAVLLCFDDFHLVETNAALQLFLQKLTSSKYKQIKLLLITRQAPTFLTFSKHDELGGLALADAQAFLIRRAVILPEDLVRKLHHATDGNATLLTLAAVALQATDQPASLIEQLIKIDDIERFLMMEVNDHLQEEEQQVMVAVALLQGHPATRSYLEHVLERQNVRRVLRDLQDRFLLTTQKKDQEHGYRQHQIIQAFYYDQPRHDRRLGLHKRAADYYAQVSFVPFLAVQQYALAATAVTALHIAKENMWAIVNAGLADALLQILESLPAADLEPLVDLDRLILCGKLQVIVGAYDRAQYSWETAVSQLNDQPVNETTNTFKAQVCLGMAELLERQAPSEALTWLQRGLEIVPRHETQLIASLKVMTGTVHMHMGNFGGALEMFHDGLDDLPTGLSPLRVNALKNLGAVYFNLDQLAEAKAYSLQALALSQRLHDHYQTARIYINLGPIKYTAGDWQGAIDDLEAGLDLARKLGALDTILSLHTNLGGMYVEKGEHEQAFQHLNEVLQLAGENDVHQVITAKIRLAQLHNYEGEWQTAVSILQEAETAAQQINDQASLATIYGYLASAQLGLGALQVADELIHEALQLDKALGYQFSMAENLRILGTIAVAQHEAATAGQAFKQSLEIFQSADPYQAALTQLSWGSWLWAAGERDQGEPLLTQAGQQFKALGARREIEITQKFL